ALHELRDGKRVCIEKVERKQVVRDTILVGDQFPAHAGATGKALLAHLPKAELRAYLGAAKTLARLKKRGVAFICGERVMDGLCAISAPIFDADGRVRHCITVTLTPFRQQAKGREKLFNLVKEAARAISRKMGAPAQAAAFNGAREEKKRIFV